MAQGLLFIFPAVVERLARSGFLVKKPEHVFDSHIVLFGVLAAEVRIILYCSDVCLYFCKLYYCGKFVIKCIGVKDFVN